MADPSLDPQIPSLASTLDDSNKYGTSLRDTLLSDQRYKTFLLGFPIPRSLAPILQNKLFSLAGLPWEYQLLKSTNQDDAACHWKWLGESTS